MSLHGVYGYNPPPSTLTRCLLLSPNVGNCLTTNHQPPTTNHHPQMGRKIDDSTWDLNDEAIDEVSATQGSHTFHTSHSTLLLLHSSTPPLLRSSTPPLLRYPLTHPVPSPHLTIRLWLAMTTTITTSWSRRRSRSSSTTCLLQVRTTDSWYLLGITRYSYFFSIVFNS